ncbi:low molecular weight protein arginine phosphatase [Peribacillus sp. NPDC097264]|uniref:low molecular weight protein arginine phosphatase n=1 Tax=unclassified Peribacillus TaxID=2675266 RepID=UPI00381F703B
MIRVLFVCTGNTCRSPMAEAILKSKNISGIEVRSAGVYATPGQDASEYAKRVLDENDMWNHHRSTLLSQQDLDWATHIFTMTEGHKSVILNTFPTIDHKTFTLKEFIQDDKYDKDILDPFGGSENLYRETFKELHGLIVELVKRLKE